MLWFVLVQSSAAPATPVSAQAGVSAGVIGSPEQQQQLLAQFMRVTGMNQAYSLQCLAGNQWNADVALNDFTALKQSGQLPPEAFVN
eukprot:m.1009163 g.1009163  ORF g.1009163 m.1009163 type:complete len:87 (+) comp24058_c0_seq78:2944-3204(+)